MNLIKKVKKYLIVASTILIVLALNVLGTTNTSYAAELVNSAKLENIGDCGSLLKYNGVPIITTYVAYNDNGNLYPAYCLNVNLPGVGENGSYTVSANDYVTDIGLWRRVINGYPYKTIKQLGCKTKEEAFTATKHAIYCYVHNSNPDNYSAIGKAGERTLNALKQIVENANNSTETKMQTSVKINKTSSEWKEDNAEKEYISKTYEVEGNADYKKYSISIQINGKKSIPEGWKITDVKNKEKTTFNKGEKFKVLIPIKTLTNSGDFTVSVKTEMNTKPVLYGKAPSNNLQDYAITTLKYEDATGQIKDSYGENKTKIKILKVDENTKAPLEGVIFDLLNEKKDKTVSNVKTGKDGTAVIKSIMPGKYYLREIETLDGYAKYDEDIEINIGLNEEFTVTVNNLKKEKIEVEKVNKDVNVTSKIVKTELQEVKKLPVTGM